MVPHCSWAHVKSKNLQTEPDKRLIKCDDTLKTLFDADEKGFVHMLKIPGGLSKHLTKIPEHKTKA